MVTIPDNYGVQIEKLCGEKNKLHKLSYQLANALHLILPLAKGYTHQNQVGSNAQYIEEAEKALADSGFTP